MKLAQFIRQARSKGGTEISPDLDPLLLILSRTGLNRYSAESQALIRACLAVIASDGDILDADIWALGADTRGLFNAFANRRMAGEYDQDYLDMFSRKLTEFQQSYIQDR